MTDPNYLFCLDINGIHEYIFSTNRLKSITGASSIIKRLNKDETVKKLKCFGFQNDPMLSDDFIYSNGGATKVVFHDCKNAQAFEEKMHRMYAKYGIKVTTVVQKVEPCKEKESSDKEIEGPGFSFEKRPEKIKGNDNMIALVVMDGNSMGKKIEALLSATPDNDTFKDVN